MRIVLAANGNVEVASLAGEARVMGAGLPVTSIASGRSLSFAMQAVPEGSLTRSGCLLFKDGHVLLQDDDTREVDELLGSGLNPNVGNRVEIQGTAAAGKSVLPIATALINVSSVTLKEQGGCLSVAAALDARTDVPAGAAATTSSAGSSAAGAAAAGAAGKAAGTAAAAAGISTGAKIAIIAAVAGGGAGAAIAVAGSKKSTSP